MSLSLLIFALVKKKSGLYYITFWSLFQLSFYLEPMLMSCSCAPVKMKPQSFRTRMILWRGVFRRFFLSVFRPGYVKASIARRQGSCARCGACCHLTAKHGCPSLAFEEAGLSLCKIHGSVRMPNCVIFPVDARDIADRDLVAPDGVKCGFRFE